jgi:cytochrome d ubiquinol oxidase subunit II
LTGIAVVIGYALLGATWLVLKTQGNLREQMRQFAVPLGGATLALIGLVSLLTPFQDPVYFDRWFSLPGSLWTMVVPAALLALTALFWRGLKGGNDLTPFLAVLGVFVVSFVGIGISFYPMMVPPSLTIWQAAAPDSSLAFALVGALILVPIILVYTAYSYWVFRGKIDPEEGYH